MMKKHLLILGLCMGAIVNSVQAVHLPPGDGHGEEPYKISSIKEAWWGSENTWINVTEKLKYCIGQKQCGIKPTIDYLTDPIPGKRKRLYVHGVKCKNVAGQERDGWIPFAAYVDEGIGAHISCYLF